MDKALTPDNEFIYINLRDKTHSNDIGTIFPDWERGGEKLAVFSPHDDDALIGAGYAMEAAAGAGAEVYVFIFCSGDCGYSVPEQKDTIVEIRRKEALKAYSCFGVPADRIVRFEYPDFSALHYMGYRLGGSRTGAFIGIIDSVRELGITRIMLPNGYREHLDHEAVYRMGLFDAVQAGDPVVSDHGRVQKVKSFLQYSVWADFSPEDALVNNSLTCVRANRALLASAAVEEKVGAALRMYESQGRIIENLVASRKERLVNGRYMELYIKLDPRPVLDFSPYKGLIGDILK